MSQKIYALQHQKKLPKFDELDKNSLLLSMKKWGIF